MAIDLSLKVNQLQHYSSKNEKLRNLLAEYFTFSYHLQLDNKNKRLKTKLESITKKILTEMSKQF